MTVVIAIQAVELLTLFSEKEKCRFTTCSVAFMLTRVLLVVGCDRLVGGCPPAFAETLTSEAKFKN